MIFNVVTSIQAEEDLRGIFEYITFELLSPENAEKQLERLEKQVAEHNNYARRMPVVEEQIKVINHRVADLEEYHKV